MTEERPVRSPCVDICALDEHDICVGCHRSAHEICYWTRLNNTERRAVLARCEQRARESGNLNNVTGP